MKKTDQCNESPDITAIELLPAASLELAKAQVEILLEQVADWRSRRDEARARLHALRAALLEAEEYRLWLERANAAAETLKEMEDEVRELALIIYGREGRKTINQAVKIREIARLTYDPDRAFAWARQNEPRLLKLDQPRFERHALAVEKTATLDFVQITRAAQATIAQDLSLVLSAEWKSAENEARR